MAARHKILIVIVMAVCFASGYGIYWWHETSLDNIAVSNLDYRGPALDATLKLLTGDEKNTADARLILGRLPEYEQVGIIRVLAKNDLNSVRMFAVRYMRSMRDIPQLRAELARMAVEDQDETIARLASRALAGRR